MSNYSLPDIIDRAYDILKGNGLVVERGTLNLSGELASCGTEKKPNGTDGRYKVHLDFPPTLWLRNYHEGGEGRTFRLYGEDELKRLTAKEREELKERIRQQKEAARQELTTKARGGCQTRGNAVPWLTSLPGKKTRISSASSAFSWVICESARRRPRRMPGNLKVCVSSSSSAQCGRPDSFSSIHKRRGNGITQRRRR